LWQGLGLGSGFGLGLGLGLGFGLGLGLGLGCVLPPRAQASDRAAADPAAAEGLRRGH